MLSYQHLYHAGNLADVHKHAALAWVLSYMTRKDKPISYLETHGGRGLYDLAAPEAVKTGEAEAGIGQVEDWFEADHPYRAVLAGCRDEHGDTAYPGSPWIASRLLRPEDRLHVAELHPAEGAALQASVPGAHIHLQDGFDMAYSLCPPTPRRGLLLVDPSYEVKSDYTDLPRHLARIARIWPVGVLMLWYPILTDERHRGMVRALTAALPDALRHEVRFPPAREGHKMVGSGLFVVNAPWGLDGALKALSDRFAAL
ncbi:23S rRNA (adenine(2030)-N(6))-methyltransferase RlmJ [Thalassorhabdomicrobium marinisediminis]|uniref:Ribosomal RNA large subunit methyltransferase J n=1 Tax=Thalassorhabdomicrobium marinisediminis TaxID=2170577 RepID=A0A2T7FY77_9RHOB|nr:23S rRNA (adenine(2030)-N(6))-methyltransferase RlmJ [Thalassorhabdomicrobium marinisediminis]PVA07116.1 23S rRNA (adenine(2030)-N(6))-methyltransferase RlmJ [Thalassorhabdomicrobium marinisediminis]